VYLDVEEPQERDKAVVFVVETYSAEESGLLNFEKVMEAADTVTRQAQS
jgi:hypothetical protein